MPRARDPAVSNTMFCKVSNNWCKIDHQNVIKKWQILIFIWDILVLTKSANSNFVLHHLPLKYKRFAYRGPTILLCPGSCNFLEQPKQKLANVFTTRNWILWSKWNITMQMNNFDKVDLLSISNFTMEGYLRNVITVTEYFKTRKKNTFIHLKRRKTHFFFYLISL